MVKIFVHDFYFEESKLDRLINAKDFCLSLNIYYNFSADEPDDGWDDLEYFTIMIATPFGLANYLRNSMSNGLLPSLFFFPHLLIAEEFNKEQIMSFIKEEVQSIRGKSQREVILRALRKFDWENERIPEIYDKLFI